MFWSLGNAMSIILINLCYLLILNRHIWSPCSRFLFYPIFRDPVQLYLVIFYNCFCSHFSLCQYWLFSSNPFSTAYIVIRTFNSLLCFFRYSLPASIWHLDAWCVTPSTHFLQSRHLSESMCMPLFLF